VRGAPRRRDAARLMWMLIIDRGRDGVVLWLQVTVARTTTRSYRLCELWRASLFEFSYPE
jgi:hypothetical protein